MPNAQPTSSDSAHSVRTASDTGEQPGNRTPIGDSQPASSYHSGNPPTTSDHSTKGNNASSTPVDGHSADRPPDSISRSAASTSSTEQLLSPRVVTVINGSKDFPMYAVPSRSSSMEVLLSDSDWDDDGTH